MTDKQPEALRLADAIDPFTRKFLDNLTCHVAAAELRRLHAVEEEARFAYMEGYEAAKDDCRTAYAELRAENAQLLEALENSSRTAFIDPSKAHLRDAAIKAAKEQA